ncbi:tumor necrosis factor ligand superfamily member 6 [Platysternon megacephalum]|uniref:Tumor necrosis factor ligand superfamily member 6 n=1 Tax=Platysternon megacephalum TaxID=55544 RepID=A0A4D9EJW2_9SAUR|nr:tumor necrosis factor ligand superfamily member 6 [Platysternon megacephalum]
MSLSIRLKVFGTLSHPFGLPHAQNFYFCQLESGVLSVAHRIKPLISSKSNPAPQQNLTQPVTKRNSKIGFKIFLGEAGGISRLLSHRMIEGWQEHKKFTVTAMGIWT